MALPAVSKEHEERVIELYLEHKLSMDAIGKQMHCSRTAIRACLVRNEISIRKRGTNAPERLNHREYEKTVVLYNAGMDGKQIANILGLTPSGVYRRLDYAGVKRRQLAERTHCANGHEFTEENTRRSERGRVCRACAVDITQRYRQRKSETP